MKPKKPSASDRTLGLFGNPAPVEVDEKGPIEAEETTEKGERVPLEQDADRFREKAFAGQEWTSKYFGSFDAPGNEYRVSKRGHFYYLETLHKEPGKPTAYAYSGLMVHERDIMELTKVMVAAVRAKQAAERPPMEDK